MREEETLKRTKEQIERARKVAQEDAMELGTAPGMTIQELAAEDEEPQDSTEVPAKKIPERKTKAERRKAEKLRAEKRLLAERAAQKRLLASVPSAKALRKRTLKTIREREDLLRARHAQQEQEKLAKGLVGQRFGKHFVPEGEIDVQLGEDLSESLRAMKPEGNLFKDRFLSMQQRALIEPRVPVKYVPSFCWLSRELTIRPGRNASLNSRSMRSMLGRSSIASKTEWYREAGVRTTMPWYGFLRPHCLYLSPFLFRSRLMTIHTYLNIHTTLRA